MKPLKRIEEKCWHFVGDEKIDGVHDKITGDVTALRGNVTGLCGNATAIPMEARKDTPNIEEWIEE